MKVLQHVYDLKYKLIFLIHGYNAPTLSGVFNPSRARGLNGKQVRLKYAKPSLCCPRNGKQVRVVHPATVANAMGRRTIKTCEPGDRPVSQVEMPRGDGVGRRKFLFLLA